MCEEWRPFQSPLPAWHARTYRNKMYIWLESWSMKRNTHTQTLTPTDFHTSLTLATHTWHICSQFNLVSRHFLHFLSSVWNLELHHTHTHTPPVLFHKLHWAVKWRLKWSSSISSTANGCFVICCVGDSTLQHEAFYKTDFTPWNQIYNTKKRHRPKRTFREKKKNVHTRSTVKLKKLKTQCTCATRAAVL